MHKLKMTTSGMSTLICLAKLNGTSPSHALRWRKRPMPSTCGLGTPVRPPPSTRTTTRTSTSRSKGRSTSSCCHRTATRASASSRSGRRRTPGTPRPGVRSGWSWTWRRAAERRSACLLPRGTRTARRNTRAHTPSWWSRFESHWGRGTCCTFRLCGTTRSPNLARRRAYVWLSTTGMTWSSVDHYIH